MTPMLDCDAVMRQLWDFLDGELTATREAAIREHLPTHEAAFQLLSGTDVKTNDFYR